MNNNNILNKTNTMFEFNVINKTDIDDNDLVNHFKNAMNYIKKMYAKHYNEYYNNYSNEFPISKFERCYIIYCKNLETQENNIAMEFDTLIDNHPSIKKKIYCVVFNKKNKNYELFDDEKYIF